MTRFARLAIVSVAALLGGVVAARAQSAPGPEKPFTAEVTTAATLGHKSSGSIGLEIDYRMNAEWRVFFEGGHIANSATSDFDNRAQFIANQVGASQSAVEKVNYFDIGARYEVPNYMLHVQPRFHPYVTLGIGAAHVRTSTHFSVNGTDVSAESLGIGLGSDLSGAFTRPLLMIGFGTTFPFKTRYLLDLSYRWGHVYQEVSNSELILRGINTQRVQIGFGYKFGR
jgi:opacity protein-like surface antigen